jgi:hypothetical protein
MQVSKTLRVITFRQTTALGDTVSTRRMYAGTQLMREHICITGPAESEMRRTSRRNHVGKVWPGA